MKRAFLALLLLSGCDAAELERIRARSEVNERIRIRCVPEPEERVVVGWYDGHLLCWRYPKQQIPSRSPTPAIVATTEELEE